MIRNTSSGENQPSGLFAIGFLTDSIDSTEETTMITFTVVTMVSEIYFTVELEAARL